MCSWNARCPGQRLHHASVILYSANSCQKCYIIKIYTRLYKKQRMDPPFPAPVRCELFIRTSNILNSAVARSPPPLTHYSYLFSVLSFSASKSRSFLLVADFVQFLLAAVCLLHFVAICISTCAVKNSAA